MRPGHRVSRGYRWHYRVLRPGIRRRSLGRWLGARPHRERPIEAPSWPSVPPPPSKKNAGSIARAGASESESRNAVHQCRRARAGHAVSSQCAGSVTGGPIGIGTREPSPCHADCKIRVAGSGHGVLAVASWVHATAALDSEAESGVPGALAGTRGDGETQQHKNSLQRFSVVDH